jgi:hypothetical protein
MAKKNSSSMLFQIIIIGLFIWLTYKFLSGTKSTTPDRSAPVGGGLPSSGSNGQTLETWTTVLPEETVCIEGKIHIRQVSNKGNYRWLPTNEDCAPDPEPTEAFTINTVIEPEEETDTLDLSELYGDYDKSKFIANWGFSGPVFRGDTDLAAPLKAGFSHMHNSSAYPDPILPDEAASKFIVITNSFYDTVLTIAGNLVSEYPSAQHVVDENWAEAIDLEMIDELGKHFSSYALMVDDPAVEDGMRWGGYCLYDEEEVSGGYYAELFFQHLASAIKLYKPQCVLTYYGRALNNLSFDLDKYWRNVPANKIAEYKSTALPASLTRGNVHINGNDAYVKSPLPLGPVYEVVGGQKKLITEEFSETLYGIENTWLPEPHAWMSDEVKGIKKPDNTYISDMEFAVAGPYRMNLHWQILSYMQAFTAGHGTDKSRWRDYPSKLISVDSLLTEPGTYGGNSPFRRWIGPEQIKFNILGALFSGFAGVELWEGGWLSEQFKNPDYPYSSGSKNLPQQGEAAFPHWGYEEDWGIEGVIADNFSRYKDAAKAVSVFREVMDHYTLNTNLRYLDFNHVGEAIGRKEIILKGIYQGSNLHLMAFYPFHNPEDETVIQLDLGGEKHAIKLTGRTVKVVHIPGYYTGLDPEEFKARYTNWNGETVKVTGDPENHNY